MQNENNTTKTNEKKCLIITYSYHHGNTAKIAQVFSEAFHAEMKTPKEVVLAELQNYDLIAFGAGIDSGGHYKPLLDLADQLPQVDKKESIIFSTSAVQGERKVNKDHTLLRQKLESKGYIVIGEFSCKGFNTNLFLKYLGGMNKGRPNSQDLQNAREFALSLLAN